MLSDSSILTVNNVPGVSTTDTPYCSTSPMHDMISIISRDTIGDIASILFDTSCCFWSYENHRVLMDNSRFYFKNSRSSRAAVFPSSVIWYRSLDKNASLMWNFFISFDTALSAHLPHLFRGRCPHDILWKIRNHLLKVVNNGHPNFPAMEKSSSMPR